MIASIAAHHTKSIGHPGLGAEVIHFIVQQKARAFNYNAAAVIPIQGIGVADRVTLFVDNGKVRGLMGFQARFDIGGR